MTLDPMDRRILAAVQQDAEQPAEAIAAEVNLSPSAVQRRIARMKKDGVIQRVSAVVDPKSVGLNFTVLVEIGFESERPEAAEQFKRWVRSEGVIQSCWYVTGEADYLLVVNVRDLDAYNDFTKRLMGERLGVRKFKSLIALQTLKQGLDLELG
jgi:DNA-binding Lrp family transcriptional regulator